MLVVIHVDPDELRFAAPNFVRQFRGVWERVMEMHRRDVDAMALEAAELVS